VSQENVERARRAYTAMREAYKAGDIESLTDLADEFCHPDLVFSTEALENMWLEPDDFIDAGDRVLVQLRIGGTARHAGLPVEFSVIHSVTVRDGKAARIDVYERVEEAIKAAGLRE
jgi:predicted lipid-binding transport protein (Tim44 family)